MKVNEGGVDRILRVIVGIVLIAGAYLYLDGTWAWVAGVVGAIAFLTGAIGICPAYAIMGFNTCPVRRGSI